MKFFISIRWTKSHHLQTKVTNYIANLIGKSYLLYRIFYEQIYVLYDIFYKRNLRTKSHLLRERLRTAYYISYKQNLRTALIPYKYILSALHIL